MSKTRKSYPSDVKDDEWEFLVSYLTLMTEDAPQREYPLRAVFNALRYVVKTGCPWRYLPNDFPPWTVAKPVPPTLRAYLFSRHTIAVLCPEPF